MIIVEITGSAGVGKTLLGNFLYERLTQFYKKPCGRLSECRTQKERNNYLNIVSDGRYEFVVIDHLAGEAAANINISSTDNNSKAAIQVFAALGGPEWWSNK